MFQTADGHMNIAVAGRRSAAVRPRERPRGTDRGSRLRDPGRRARTGCTERGVAAILCQQPTRMDRPAERRGCCMRADLHDGSGVRRSAGAAPRARPRRCPRTSAATSSWWASRSRAGPRASARRRRRASTPRRSWASSATTTPHRGAARGRGDLSELLIGLHRDGRP